MVGRHRNPLTVVLLSIVTLGIYLLYWIYITFAEVRAHRGKGTSGIVGLLLALIPVSIFLLPSHVGDMYAEAGKTKPHHRLRRPVGAHTARRRHRLAVQGAEPPQRVLGDGGSGSGRGERSEPAPADEPAPAAAPPEEAPPS